MIRKFYLVLFALIATIGQVNAQTAVFTETFDNCSGTGGNDGLWSGISSGSELSDTYTDNAGWTATRGYVASKCVRFGTSKKQGSVTTPSISLTGKGTLTFKAGAWKGDAKTLNISAEGATLDKSSVTLTNSAFTDYTVNITGATGSVKITFTGKQASKARFFLDEVTVTSAPSTGKTATSLSFAEGDKTFYVGDGDQTFTNAATLTPTIDGASITYTSSDENVAVVDNTGAVLVTTGKTGTATITASYAGNDQYDAASASYTITVVPVCQSISEFKALSAGTFGRLKLTDAQVLYVNNNDMYVSDASGAIDFYSSGLSYTAGQVLNGTIDATYSEYNGLPEVTDITTNNLTVTDGSDPEPVTVAASDIDATYYCKLVKVSGAYDASNTTIDNVAVYDKFKNGSLDNLTDGNYTMTGIVIVYKNAPELAVISAESNDVTATIGTSGYATLYYSDRALTVPENVTAYVYSYDESAGKLNVSKTYEAGATIPAGTAVVLNAAAGDYTFDVSSEAGEAASSTNLYGTDIDATTSVDGMGKYYMLSLNANSDANSVGFYWGADNGAAFTCAAHKAYLALPASAQAKGFAFNGTVDGISSVSLDAENDNAPVYSITGVRMGNNLPAGIYVKNGKKFIVK